MRAQLARDRFGYAVCGAYWLGVILATVYWPARLDKTAQAVFLGLELTGLIVTVGTIAMLRLHRGPSSSDSAFRDELTGLPNRSLFLDRLQEASSRSLRQNKMIAVLFIDLDRFKLVNDTFGHPVGDKLLVNVSQRFRRQVRAGETLARFGGDEFTVVMEGLNSVKGAEALAERLLASLATPISLEGHEVVASSSIGIAVALGNECPPTELVRRADIALYEAKAAGRSNWKVYKPGDGMHSFELLEMDSGIRKALERKELCLYFQPQISLSTGEIVGMEALVRWLKPDQGLLLPGSFLPSAEEAGLMRSIDRWVLQEACESPRHWQAAELPQIGVSVNLSPPWLRDSGLVAEVARVLERTGLPASQLKLELLESAVIEDMESSLKTLAGLKALGVHLSLDDFGTGYSSLAYLRQLPIDELKLDRSFIADLADDPRVRAIVKSVVTLAHGLGMQVTAEGVEANEQLSLLMEVGCDQAQGYIFSRPMPSEAVANYLGSTKVA